MEARTTFQDEEIPASYPASASNISTAGDALATVAWQRIEGYVAHRWTLHGVAWIAEGPGTWRPPLTPASITLTEVWAGSEWLAIDLEPHFAGGFVLPTDGAYRFSGTVGGGAVPAAVTEAHRRLAEYMAAKAGKPGATSERIQAGSIALSHTRSESWMAKAMQNSGAADLLRPYRRA